MFDLMPSSHPAANPWRPAAARYAPQARALTQSTARQRQPAAPEAIGYGALLMAALDEIDFGMVVVDSCGQAIHVNNAARIDLDHSHPLQLLGSELRTRLIRDAGPLQAALQAAAQRGLRKLLTLGDGAQRVSVSVVPITGTDHERGPATLLMLGKRQVCGDLAAQGFARMFGLTGAETRVLTALCGGIPPSKVAEQLGVAISTVRTQIGNIRVKTGTRSIRDLVRQVAMLPPMMGVLRGAAATLNTFALDDAALSAP